MTNDDDIPLIGEKRPVSLTITAALMLLTAAGTILFWGTFFADPETQHSGHLASRCDAWFAWEMSFPLADGWMAATAILGAVGLWRMRPAGLLFGLVSGGAIHGHQHGRPCTHAP